MKHLDPRRLPRGPPGCCPRDSGPLKRAASYHSRVRRSSRGTRHGHGRPIRCGSRRHDQQHATFRRAPDSFPGPPRQPIIRATKTSHGDWSTSPSKLGIYRLISTSFWNLRARRLAGKFREVGVATFPLRVFGDDQIVKVRQHYHVSPPLGGGHRLDCWRSVTIWPRW